jgi:uroporphyrinogen-III synthase
LKGKKIAILETRTGAHLGELIERRGAVALLAPALNEVPDIDLQAVSTLLDAWHAMAYRLVIFQTGVGTRALFKATDTLGRTAQMVQSLASATVAVRGPKPVGELNARGVRIDLRAASPFTTQTLLDCLAPIDLKSARVLVQRYGEPNETLRAELQARFAAVDEIATYRWALPDDVQPLLMLLSALSESRVDAVVFTSAVQIRNLVAVAAAHGQADGLAARISKLVVASIGPVCSRELLAHGITPTFEADPPKLGPLVAALEKAWD